MPPTVRELVTHLVKTLASTIRPLDQRWFEAELLVGHILKQDRTWIALHPDVRVTQTELRRISELAERRVALEPLAYLFKQAPFFGQTFFVDQRVLIPRPESEWLVQTAIEETSRTKKPWAVWDVGTGSGCLALSIAHALPHVQVLASDASPSAITVAKLNAKRLETKNVTVCRGSLVASSIKRWLTIHGQKHWLIVANLPYLPQADQPKMQKQVTGYEPLSALFAKQDGLWIINQFIDELKPLLEKRTGDIVFFEHDPRQAKKLATHLQTIFPRATISTELDQNGAKRFTVLKT